MKTQKILSVLPEGRYLLEDGTIASPIGNITYRKGERVLEDNGYIYGHKWNRLNPAFISDEVKTKGLYFLFNPVHPVTRALQGKQYFILADEDINTVKTLTPTSLSYLSYNEIIDDAAYWSGSAWDKKESLSALGVPLGAGGPQSLIKFLDPLKNTLRYVANVSYEKEAYQAYQNNYKTPAGVLVKSILSVLFQGSPMLCFGAYEENSGWMEYSADGLWTVLPKLPANPQYTQYFTVMPTLNFWDWFLEAGQFKFYGFYISNNEELIPQDSQATLPSVIGVDKPAGFDYINVSVPSIFSYIRPNPYWVHSPSLGSSGYDNYRFFKDNPSAYLSHSNKCTSEAQCCGNVGGPFCLTFPFIIPYNYNSFVKVFSQTGNYYEELYINGIKREFSAPDTFLKTHYQLLAVYKNIAVVRETNWVSKDEYDLSYRSKLVLNPQDQQLINSQIISINENFTAKYYIYINGVKYNLTGLTTIKSKVISFDPTREGDPSDPLAYYLTFEYVDDITGYHIDRIFINESLDSEYILVVFDEYSYNSGKGMIHNLTYEQSDMLDGLYFLFYKIPLGYIQACDHVGARVGRQMLLFKKDGTLVNKLTDPIGLNYTIGQAGILN